MHAQHLIVPLGMHRDSSEVNESLLKATEGNHCDSWAATQRRQDCRFAVRLLFSTEWFAIQRDTRKSYFSLQMCLIAPQHTSLSHAPRVVFVRFGSPPPQSGQLVRDRTFQCLLNVLADDGEELEAVVAAARGHEHSVAVLGDEGHEEVVVVGVGVPLEYRKSVLVQPSMRSKSGEVDSRRTARNRMAATRVEAGRWRGECASRDGIARGGCRTTASGVRAHLEIQLGRDGRSDREGRP